MEDRVYAIELAGYCNELTAWRILRDISASLLKQAGAVSPALIMVRDDGFELERVEGAVDIGGFEAPEVKGDAHNEASAVWSLAASVFYLVMGCQIMNGKGGKGQHATSKVPYMRSELAKMSELVQQCLQYRPELRPSAKKVNKIATEQYKICAEIVSRGPKFRKKTGATDEKTSINNELAFWPEPMRQ